MKTKMFYLSFPAMMFLATQCYSQKTVTGFEAPESALKAGDHLFVSNIGGATPNPMALDSNGFISEVSLTGEIIQKKFQHGILNAPKGLAVEGGVLYTADVNRVVGFDLSSGNQVFELNIPGAMMLNDLCTAGSGQLVVSETISGQIFSLNLAQKSYAFLGRIDGANGVTYDAASGILYACGMGVNMNATGKLFEKNMNSRDTVFMPLPNSPIGIFDGLELPDKDHLLVTDWISTTSAKGRFVIYSLKDHSSKIYPVDAGPADIGYDKASHNFYLPLMMKNSLLIDNISHLKEQ
jgi:hypothetical protein